MKEKTTPTSDGSPKPATRLVSFKLRLLAVVLLALVPFVAVMFAEARSDHAAATRRARADVSYAVAARVANVNGLLDRTREALITLSADPAVQEGRMATAAEFSRRIKAANPMFVNVAVAKPNGDVVASAVPLDGPVNVGDRDYFLLAISKRDFSVGGYQVGRIARQPMIVAAYPVLTPEGRLVGVVYASLDLRAVAEAFDRGPAPAGTVATLFDEEGHIVARQPDGQRFVGRKVSDSGFVHTAISHPTAPVTLAGFDGVRRVYAFGTAYEQAGQGLYASVGLDEAALFASETRDYLWKLAELVALAGFVVLTALAAANILVVHPLRSLREVVGRLAQGDLAARSNLPRANDEIGGLAAECDAMAEALQHHVEETRRNEQQYRELVRLLPVGVFVLDAERRVQVANDAGLRMLGAPELGADGVAFDEHVAEKDRERFAAFVDAVFAGRLQPVLGVELRDGLGRQMQTELAGAFLDDAEPWVLLVANDVTERSAVDQLKSDFLAMVSHELRTPLTTIAGCAQLMQQPEHQEPERVLRLSQRVEERAHHLARLVEEMLRVLQAEARAFCGEKRPADLGMVVEACVRELDARGHEVEVHVPEDMRRVSCDADAVAHAVSNLLENAVKFSPDGGRIVVSVAQERRRTTIAVADEGVGVPDDVREHIFDRFVQADMSSTRRFDGFGLGLFIVQQVAVAHDGAVKVEPREPRGSVFTLEIGDAA